jgi:hypothetical protein
MTEREIIKPEGAHVLGRGNGSPKIVIDRGPTSTVVSVMPCPWGFHEGRAVEFLHGPSGPRAGGAADRHAQKLKVRLEYAAARDLERLARMKANGGGL